MVAQGAAYRHNGLCRQGYECGIVTASAFVNGDGRGLHSDHEKQLGALAPHAPTSQYLPTPTGKACPEETEGTMQTRT